eukprot:2104817-Alexandrium_andersonii.AAC.1
MPRRSLSWLELNCVSGFAPSVAIWPGAGAFSAHALAAPDRTCVPSVGGSTSSKGPALPVLPVLGPVRKVAADLQEFELSWDPGTPGTFSPELDPWLGPGSGFLAGE